MKQKVVLALGLVPLLAAGLAAAAKVHFDSRSPGGAITIDGNFDDWTNPEPLEPFGEQALSMQIANDNDWLYLRFATSDVNLRSEILRQGLTVWFDPAGGTKKKIGVRYPVVDRASGYGGGGSGGDDGGYGGYGGRRRGGGSGTGTGTGTTDQPSSGTSAEAGQPPARQSENDDRVDLLGPGKDDQRALTRDHLEGGVEVAYRYEQGTLQYELKLPMHKSTDHPFALDAKPGSSIGLGLETEKAQRPAMSGGRGGGGGFGGGGFGRGGGGRGGGGMRGGGGGGGMGAPQAKPLKAWASVSLKNP